LIVKREKLQNLMNAYCGGNYNRFGRELDINVSHLHRYINHGIGGGKKLMGAVIKFCKSKGLNFEEYVEL
jgi:hypothetical protein